jgi:hypothetical protein
MPAEPLNEPDLLETAIKDGVCSESLAKLLRKRLDEILSPVGHPPTVLDTEDWQLTAVVKWVPKDRKIPCPACSGSGQRTGFEYGFGMDPFDDPNDRRCRKCYGHGSIMYHPDESTKPVVPDGLLEHLHAAWEAYFHDQQKPPQKGTENANEASA